MPEDVLLRDGAIASVREVVPADRSALLALHEGLSDGGRYLRFFQMGHTDSSRFVDDLLACLARGDAVAEVAVVQG